MTCSVTLGKVDQLWGSVSERDILPYSWSTSSPVIPCTPSSRILSINNLKNEFNRSKNHINDILAVSGNSDNVFSSLHLRTFIDRKIRNNLKNEFNDSMNLIFNIIDGIICNFQILPPQWNLQNRSSYQKIFWGLGSKSFLCLCSVSVVCIAQSSKKCTSYPKFNRGHWSLNWFFFQNSW